MKKKIYCNFVDFWLGFNYKTYFWYLSDEYDLQIEKDHPDYLFYSCFGNEHLFYEDCIRIFFSGENIIPDLNMCDYGVSLSHIRCDDRTFRMYGGFIYDKDFHLVLPLLKEEALLNRKFCNFVYSNNICAVPYRELFFKTLSGYKRIDSGGAFLNNMGKKVGDKRQFLHEYKFTLAIENSSMPGYVTEKILEPFMAQSLPLYWGSPTVSSDYNPNSFVNLMNYSSMEEAVEEVIRLDKDDAAYLDKMMTPFWLYGANFQEFRDSEIKKIKDFFSHIFEQPLDKAGRRVCYGRNKITIQKQRRCYAPTFLELSKSMTKKLLKKK